MTAETKMIGTFKIVETAPNAFDVVDTCTFNNWGVSAGYVTFACAETYALWAHAFKTGKTFMGAAEYTRARDENAAADARMFCSA